MIEAWEHRSGDRCYLSRPLQDGRRYRVRLQGSRWTAQHIRFATGVGFGNVVAHVGSFANPKAGMAACQAHDEAAHATP